MDEFMDTVDPRVERAFTKTGRHVPVSMRRYHVWGGRVLTFAIALLSAIVIFA